MTETRHHRRGSRAVPALAAVTGLAVAGVALMGLGSSTPGVRVAMAVAGLALLVLSLAAVTLERELRLRRALADLDDERTRSDALAHEAAHDPLTGVLNRNAFLARLDLALGRARLHERRLALLFLDLDGFKQVNDILGHDVGDSMLIRVGERLRSCVRPADVVARFGGDEFVVLLEDLSDQEQAFEIAERVQVALSIPFVVDGRRLGIGVSVGLTFSVGGREPARALVREADAAMYLAKRAGTLDLSDSWPLRRDDPRVAGRSSTEVAV